VIFALLALAQEEALRRALENTAAQAYAYQVKGRFERAGEWTADGVLTSRMKQYQSARVGEKILVKGPEGLWKTPDERIGERVENPDPEAVDIVRTLSGAEPPHRLVERLLQDVTRIREPEERELEGVPCERYSLYYKSDVLKDALQKALEKAIAAGLPKPDEIRWSSGLKGQLRVYVRKKDRRLWKAVEERSVKLAYKVPDGPPEVKTYKLEMELTLGEAAPPQLPPEVKERLGLSK
jgi:hypothetical protein